MSATAKGRSLLLVAAAAFLWRCRGREQEAPSDFAIITGTSVYAAFDSAGRSTEPILVYYELTRPFTRATLEFLTRDTVTGRFPLPDLAVGQHMIRVPAGVSQAYDPPSFSCSIARAPILTYYVESVRDGRDSVADTASLYHYIPDPTPANSTIRLDAASGFRGKEIGVSAFNIPYARNEQLRGRGQAPEIEILGVNLYDGMQASCSRGEPPIIRAAATIRDVKVVSTISHEDNDDIPVLQAARFSVPRAVLEPQNTLRIVGVAKQR